MVLFMYEEVIQEYFTLIYSHGWQFFIEVSIESLLVILAKSCCLCYTLSRIEILMFYERYPSWSWSFARFTIM